MIFLLFKFSLWVLIDILIIQKRQIVLKYQVRKILLSLVGSGIAMFMIYFACDGYHKSITLSKYEIATNKLSFSSYTKNNQTVSAAQQQDALIKTT
ncbi:MAG: hypothetical protein EOP33_03235 [Rickettsiaceae bacterium]|nr:MAG: hypothetical protein EOP33_03235 [Rickettsiaceae bacterium]